MVVSHYYDHWQELSRQAWGEPSWVGLSLRDAWDELEAYANDGGIGSDALDALEAAEEFLRGASLGIGDGR